MPATPSPSASASAAALASPAVLGARTGGTGRLNFGIASGLADYSPAQLNTALAGMRALGVHWVRFDMDWSIVQADGAGSYNWGDYDRVVSALNAHGLSGLAILDYTPGWARPGSCSDSQFCAPANAGDYANFASAAVGRYRSQGLRAWEIWNEENVTAFYQPAANPGGYAGLLRAANAAIKAADGGATVVSGGLAPSGDGGGNMSPSNFLTNLYYAGARGSFDVLGDHPYTYPYSAAYQNPYDAWGQMGQLHGIMAGHGDGGKQIWITEYGSPTGGPGPLASSGMTATEDSADHVTEALQAREVVAAVHLASAYSWVGAFFWYSYLDPGTDPSTNENFFGLVRADGSHKAGFAAYQSAISHP
jgi:hypothetical protein